MKEIEVIAEILFGDNPIIRREEISSIELRRVGDPMLQTGNQTPLYINYHNKYNLTIHKYLTLDMTKTLVFEDFNEKFKRVRIISIVQNPDKTLIECIDDVWSSL
jgi:hypothetical protein